MKFSKLLVAGVVASLLAIQPDAQAARRVLRPRTYRLTCTTGHITQAYSSALTIWANSQKVAGTDDPLFTRFNSPSLRATGVPRVTFTADAGGLSGAQTIVPGANGAKDGVLTGFGHFPSVTPGSNQAASNSPLIITGLAPVASPPGSIAGGTSIGVSCTAHYEVKVTFTIGSANYRNVDLGSLTVNGVYQ